MTAIDSIVARLLALHPKRIDLSLDRMWRAARRARPSRAQAAAGDPCRRHQRQGLDHRLHARDPGGGGPARARLHLAASRALQRALSARRARASGRLVGRRELGSALDECERVNAGAPITVFEITTAAGLLLFARHPADVLLLEVGLGGRLDATNVIERPLASVITPVSLDHAEYLGDTLGEDRGREGRHPQARRAGDRRRAAARGAGGRSSAQAARVKAPIRIAGEDWTATEERGRLVYQDDDGLLDLPAPKLLGRHQFENAGVAIAALRAVGELKLAA